MIEKRRLGRTELAVFPLGLGGHTYPIGMGPDDWVTPDERAALVKRLVDGGVNYFDTTWVNEVEVLADAFRRAGVGHDCIVSLQHVDGVSDRAWRTELRGQVERRLEIMGWSRAPLFLIGVGNGRPMRSEIEAAVEALAWLREEGLIQFLGVSCHEPLIYDDLAEVIERTDLIDYMMIRYNWKHREASQRLYAIAQAHDVGLVGMKAFCWDCGPGQWGRRISVFEPTIGRPRLVGRDGLTAAQRSLIWTLANSPASVVVPAMNAAWEADENLAAMERLGEPVSVEDLPEYEQRLWLPQSLQDLADSSPSITIRDRARGLLGADLRHATVEEAKP